VIRIWQNTEPVLFYLSEKENSLMTFNKELGVTFIRDENAQGSSPLLGILRRFHF